MSEKNNYVDSEIIKDSLQKVAKGSAIVFVAIMLNSLLFFLGRLLIIRNWTQSDYGIFSLAAVILTIAVFISGLGLPQGAVRNISYYRSKKDIDKIPALISTSLFFNILASVIIGFIIFVISEYLCLNFFHEPNLLMPLRIFSIGIPIYNAIEIVLAFFRGFGDVKTTSYFKYIFIDLFFTIMLAFLIVFNLGFIYIFYAYLFSLVAVLTILSIFVIIKIRPLKYLSLKSINSPVSRDLIIFSLPLLGSTLLISIIFWTDTFMLSSIRTYEEVGLYTAITPLAQFINFPMNASAFIYVPVISGLFAKNQWDNIKRTFTILTKWLTFSILPVFLIIFLYPSEILGFLYGPDYSPGYMGLRILCCGFFVNVLFGQSQTALVGIGKTRFILLSSFMAAFINVVLNIILIPDYGVFGAVTASFISIFSTSVFRSIILYRLTGIQPFSKNLLKPVVLSFVIIFSLYFVLNSFISLNILMIASLFVIFYVIIILSIIITKSLDKEDLDLFRSIEKRTGIKLTFLNRFIERFL